MYLASQACFDPEALELVFAWMNKARQDGSGQNLAIKPPKLLSTHPSNTSYPKHATMAAQSQAHLEPRRRSEGAVTFRMKLKWEIASINVGLPLLRVDWVAQPEFF